MYARQSRALLKATSGSRSKLGLFSCITTSYICHSIRIKYYFWKGWKISDDSPRPKTGHHLLVHARAHVPNQSKHAPPNTLYLRLNPSTCDSLGSLWILQSIFEEWQAFCNILQLKWSRSRIHKRFFFSFSRINIWDGHQEQVGLKGKNSHVLFFGLRFWLMNEWMNVFWLYDSFNSKKKRSRKRRRRRSWGCLETNLLASQTIYPNLSCNVFF